MMHRGVVVLGRLGSVLAVAAVVLASGARVAEAQVFTLTSCDTSALASALSQANKNNQDNTIKLLAGCTYVYTSGHGVVAEPNNGGGPDGHMLVIGGGPAAIEGNGNLYTPVVDVAQYANLELYQVTITSGGEELHSAILNFGTLTLLKSAVTGNTTEWGAIWTNDNGAPVTLNHSSVSNNAGPGIVMAGPGSPQLTMDYSTVSNNTGGGVVTQGGPIVDSTIADNTGAISGGGIASSGPLQIYGSTISGNSAQNGGGVVGGGGKILNSTIADNTATGYGGGLYTGGGNQHLTIQDSTLAGNSAPNGGNLAVASAPSFVASLKATILANPAQGGDCNIQLGSGEHFYDSGYNLADDGTCGFTTAHGSLSSTPAGLDPSGLQNNGGPTETIALEPSSPAVDYVPVSASPSKTDQRGLPRPDSDESFADIGAYELQDG